MKSSVKHLIGNGLLILILVGCSKGGSNPPVVVPDTTKPTISISNPTAGQAFVAGDNIPFKATFADNVALQSYAISIDKKVLGGMVLKVVPTSVPFSYSKPTTSISGKSQEIILNGITIPTNTPTEVVSIGVYNLNVTCVDSSSNSYSTTMEININ